MRLAFRRQPQATARQERDDWLAWLELGGARPATVKGYRWTTDRLLDRYPELTFEQFTDETRNGTAYRLRRSVPRTSVTDSLFWPTPVAHDDGKTPEAHLAMKARMPGGARKTITSLTVMVKAVERKLWPTPLAGDAKGSRSRTGPKAHSGTSLTDAARESMLPTPTANRWSGLQSHGRNAMLGPLNPTWVEWLMGCPLGWTDCELSETASSLRSRAGSANESLSVKE